jgi:5'-methylthioadenosine phosphorylase
MNRPVIGIIGGSGLGAALSRQTSGQPVEVDTPYGPPSAPLIKTQFAGLTTFFLARHGPGHIYSPSIVPYRANIFALKKLGVTHIIASGAVGSLREAITPRDLVLVDQVIDKTFRRPGTFFDEPGLVAHVEFAQPFCPALREVLAQAARGIQARVHGRGTYVCMEGPPFSTQAESRMHQAWGGDTIGMTCMPEAKLAREAEICYALIALATDYDCWKAHPGDLDSQALLAEIIGHLNAATDNAIQLVKAAVQYLADNTMAPCRCRKALELAIWTDKTRIPASLKQKLQPLIGKYV